MDAIKIFQDLMFHEKLQHVDILLIETRKWINFCHQHIFKIMLFVGVSLLWTFTNLCVSQWTSLVLSWPNTTPTKSSIQGVQKLSQEMAFLWFCVDAHWMYSFYHLFFSRPKSTKWNNFTFTNLIWIFSIYARIATINEASKVHKSNSQKKCQNLKVAHN